MCLIMTYIATAIFFVLWLFNKDKKTGSKSLLSATLMFGGAGLMWSVDGIASLLEGESFFDISIEDTVLGAIIIASGLAVYVIVSLIERRSYLKVMAKDKNKDFDYI